MKKVLFTCLTGRDGSNLTKKFLDKEYKVYGAVRRITSLVLLQISKEEPLQ